MVGENDALLVKLVEHVGQFPEGQLVAAVPGPGVLHSDLELFASVVELNLVVVDWVELLKVLSFLFCEHFVVHALHLPSR